MFVVDIFRVLNANGLLLTILDVSESRRGKGHMIGRLGVTVVAGLLAGCAGRSPQLVQVVQASDQRLTCDQIVAEIKSNNERIQDLAREEGWKVTQNVAAGVAGLFIPVLWFGMDFQDAAGKEAKALSQRNEYLSSIAPAACQRPVTTASVPAKKSS